MNFWHYLLVFIVGVLALFVLYLKSLSKGDAGEFASNVMLKWLGKNYRVFHNITFMDGEKSVQIDHIVVSVYGIFVIETKNYSGTIYGKEDSGSFIQYIGKKKNEFYSPIKQNRGHIYSLTNVIGNYKYVSIVAFSGSAKLKVESTTYVNYIGGIRKHIKSYRQALYSIEEVNEICGKISEVSLKGLGVHRRHVEDVRGRMDEYENNVRSGICPRCGKSLSMKKGKYGDFLGCSGYPRCKFKKSVGN